MRTLHSTHGFHFADLSDKYAKQHPDGVHFTYDQAATIKAAEKAPTGIAARVYKFETNIDALAETLLDLDDLDDYDIEEVIVRVKRDKAETPDDDEPDDAPAAKKAAAPAKKAAAPRKAAASGAKARTSSK